MRTVRLLCVVAFALAGCDGEISRDPLAPDAPVRPGVSGGAGGGAQPGTPGLPGMPGFPGLGTGGGSGGGTSTSAGGGQAGPACTAQGAPGAVVLHRLNRAEYDNSVRDLLGDTTHPASAFPPDDFGGTFNNVAAILSLSPLLVEKYEATAASLVNDAWSRDVAAGLSGAKVRTCDPVATAGCARTLVQGFARRAWRRPVATDEVDRLMAVAATATAQGDDASVGVRLALQAVLVSPNFLFRVERPAAGAHALAPHELAARLSYFIWSSTPDETLLARADDGTLAQPAVLTAQVTRLLNDPRASAMLDNFAAQWLQMDKLDTATPDPALFPGFDAALRTAMKGEMKAFVQALLHEDRSALELLDGQFIFVNDRLAQHYGLPDRPGPALTRIPAPAGRGGVLRQAGLLTLTSFATRTSPVKRGKWVLAQLLCAEPPPPPANVGQFPEPSGTNVTVRQRLEAHRQNPACAGCHSAMDPIGLGLENFDAVGVFRTTDATQPIDATGLLPDGRAFNGAAELATLLKGDPRLTRCMTQKMLTYALGRELAAGDACTVSTLEQQLAARGQRLSALVELVATSVPFTMRQETP
ncbi:MAG: DUF1592 domain-containing protein [Myxococcaceae bacterium]|nr:DUF1592 domain-containing protein [Myxococcaceae bacterium]